MLEESRNGRGLISWEGGGSVGWMERVQEEEEEEALVWAQSGGRGGKKKFDILKTKTEAVSLFSSVELKLPVEKKTALKAEIAERRTSRR